MVQREQLEEIVAAFTGRGQRDVVPSAGFSEHTRVTGVEITPRNGTVGFHLEQQLPNGQQEFLGVLMPSSPATPDNTGFLWTHMQLEPIPLSQVPEDGVRQIRSFVDQMMTRPARRNLPLDAEPDRIVVYKGTPLALPALLSGEGADFNRSQAIATLRAVEENTRGGVLERARRRASTLIFQAGSSPRQQRP